MRRRLLILVSIGFALQGCKKPSPVQLQPEDGDDILEVSSVIQADSNLSVSSIDSSAVLPKDQENFSGFLLLNNVKLDGGQGITSFAYSRVLFENRMRPIQLPNGRVFGYHGIDLGAMSLNGNLMFRVPHTLYRLGRRDSIAGTEYLRDLTTSYRPNTVYTWRTLADTIGPLVTSIDAPEDITVFSPRGGTIIPRDHDLELRWSGQGNLFFVISIFDPLTKRSKPIFHVRVRVNRNRAILSNKVLRLLPVERFFVFTFVLSNRRESDVVARFPGRVLVQATAVYNSYVQIL